MRSKLVLSTAMAFLLANSIWPGMVRAQSSREEAQTLTDWTVRLNQIVPDDWRSARGEVGWFAGQPPGKAIRILRALWPALTSPAVKQEITKAFVKSAHPDMLGVLALAAGDTDAKVRADGVSMIRQVLLLPQDTKVPDVLERLHRFANKPLAEAQSERLREITQQINIADATTLQSLMSPFGIAMRSASLRGLAIKSGVLSALEHRLSDPTTIQKVKLAVLQNLEGFEFPPVMLEKTLLPLAVQTQDGKIQFTALRLLAHTGYAPAYEPLLRALISAAQSGKPAVARLAASVAEYGRPDAIPTLIGLIASDNTYNTTYFIGNFGLRPLTGTEYSTHQDGNWWRLWWERNHDGLPEAVRNMPIPDFPHTKNYQEPLPREAHLDPQRYRQICLQNLTVALQRANGQENAPADAAATLVIMDNEQVIPMLIGLIASDNTPASIYGIGYYALAPFTGVPYMSTHDGNWWRLWWEQHRSELPTPVRDIAIPDLPHTPAYHEPLPIALHSDPAALRAHLLAVLK